MTIYNLVKTIKAYCTNLPNISYVEEGDVYQLNSKGDIDYPAIIISQTQHRGDFDNDNNVFGFNIFAVDRLTSDNDNKLDIQSWAKEILEDICSFVEEMNIGMIYGEIIIQPFTERFESECAGAYATLNIEIDNIDCEADSYLMRLLELIKSAKSFKSIDEIIGTKPNTLLFYNGESQLGDDGYFGIRALKNSEFKLTNNAESEFVNIEYSPNTFIWHKLELNKTYKLKKGMVIYFRGKNEFLSTSNFVHNFNITGEVELFGDIMSLIYGDDYRYNDTIESAYCFNYLFSNNTGIKYADKLILSSTTLSNGCYQYMFSGCTNLVEAPALPATTLTTNCYRSMFQDCRNLVEAPILPATTLASNCYTNMFNGCESLKVIEMLSNTHNVGVFRNWVNGVSPNGVFKKKKDVEIPVGVNGIPQGWDVIDV